MVEQLLVWLAFTVGFLLFSLARPNCARVVIGLFFIAMALGVNLVFVLVDARSYVALGSESFVPLYRDFFRTHVAASPLSYAVPVVIFELAIGVMLLGGGRVARFALVGAALFLIGISPLSVATAPNVILALSLLLMLRRSVNGAGEFGRSRGVKHVARA
jgi:hypothetical protein